MKRSPLIPNELTLMDWKNDRKALLHLLTSGADTNVKDADGRTPLMYAVRDGKDEFVDLLIQYGSNVDAQDCVDFSALHFAAQNFHLNSAEALLRAGASVDLRDSYGNTPLWRAVFSSRGRGEMIRLLLKYGADPLAKNKRGNSPLET